jgi:FkbM family methyltransferase
LTDLVPGRERPAASAREATTEVARLLYHTPARIMRSARGAWRAPDSRSRERLAFDVARLHLGAIAHRARPRRSPVTIDHLRVRFTDYPSLVHVVDEVLVDAPYAVDLASPAPVIFDCGANIGLASLFFARRFPNASITAFEPDPDAFAALTWNAEANFPNRVVAHQVALGERDGSVDFWYSPDRPGSMVGGVYRRDDIAQTRKVEVRRLSSYIDGPVDLLKVDVEGSEDAVVADLIGSGRIAHVDAILLEYHHHLTQTSLAQMLSDLEAGGFDYQVASTTAARVVDRGVFQDLLIYAYRGGSEH